MRSFLFTAFLLTPFIIGCNSANDPSPTTVPGVEWTMTTPEEVDIDPVALTNFISKIKGEGVVIRNGLMVARWGHYDHAFDVASAVKPFYAHATYMSVSEGMIESLDSPVSDYEPRLKSINENLNFKEVKWRRRAKSFQVRKSKWSFRTPVLKSKCLNRHFLTCCKHLIILFLIFLGHIEKMAVCLGRVGISYHIYVERC